MNAIGSMTEVCRDHSTNVKRWSDGQMALRWSAARMGEAARQFGRVNGHLHLGALRNTLDAHTAGSVTPACQDDQEAAWTAWSRHPRSTELGTTSRYGTGKRCRAFIAHVVRPHARHLGVDFRPPAVGDADYASRVRSRINAPEVGTWTTPG